MFKEIENVESENNKWEKKQQLYSSAQAKRVQAHTTSYEIK